MAPRTRNDDLEMRVPRGSRPYLEAIAAVLVDAGSSHPRE